MGRKRTSLVLAFRLIWQDLRQRFNSSHDTCLDEVHRKFRSPQRMLQRIRNRQLVPQRQKIASRLVNCCTSRNSSPAYSTRRFFQIGLHIPNNGIRKLASFTPVGPRTRPLKFLVRQRISPSLASLAQNRNSRIVHCLRHIRERIQDLAALLLAAIRRTASAFRFLFCFYKLRLRNRNVVVEFIRS